ncbi:hypothetical protein [Ideonella sp.]|jgi:hypothetical protein|uniref:hypothetical protein n=1 Tax=Ideonella sp. TaxID=1929293 RepID=UPI0037BE3AEB
MSEAHADAPELTERIDPPSAAAHTAAPADAAPAAHASAVIQDEGFFAVHAPGAAAGTSPQALVQAVVDWHNRHPLAARITAADVGGLGFVQLPFEAPLMVRAEEPTGWKRWFSRGPTGPKPAFFDEQLIDGLAHTRIVKFAQRHGALQRTGDSSWPTRVLLTRAGAASPQPLYLLTAAFKTPKGEVRRVLVAPGSLKQAMGRRQFSLKRIGILAGGVSLAVALTFGGIAAYKALTAPAAHPPAKAKAGAASAASAAAHGDDHAAQGDSHAKPAAAAEAGHAASGAAPGAHADAASAAVGHDAEHKAEAGQGEATAKAADAGHAAEATPAKAAAADTSPAAAEPKTAAAAPKDAKPDPVAGSIHALVTVPTWRRAEIEATQRELAKILGRHLNGMRAEILRLPEGEVLALMPLPNQTAAEELAARLAKYDILMAPVSF